MPEEKEPVDIFDTSGTSDGEEVFSDDEKEEEEEEENNEGDDESEDETEEDESEEESDDEDDDSEEGDGDESDGEVDEKDAEIERLKGLLAVKNKALREGRKTRRATNTETAEFDPPWKNLKKVAELPTEEQEAMTDREKELHDDSVEMKKQLNKDAEDRFKAEQAEKVEKIDPDALDEDETKDFVQASAMFLAKNDKKLANKIIRKFEMFKTDGLTEEKIEDALADAAKLVKGFTKQKFQPTKRGKPVKKTSKGNSTDDILKSIDSSETKAPIDL